MFIALLGKSYNKGYKGLYRSIPCAPKGKEAFELWIDCLCSTENFSFEYSEEKFKKLHKLTILLHKENISADLLLIDRTNFIPDVHTNWLGYDITNNTMFYSILGEKSPFQKTISKEWKLNKFGLLSNVSDADSIAEYMNKHIDNFEKEGIYRSVSIECVV